MGLGGIFSCETLIAQDGFKVLRFEGKNAYKCFEHEAGGHRWQGLSKGRVHSSTITVAVLPVPKVSNLNVQHKDIKIESYTGGGPGGQNRNKNATNIRITHIPTGIQACSNTKSKAQNEKLAMAMLRARLAERARGAEKSARDGKRKAQVGTGMRSDKIRTIAEQRRRVENHLNGKRMSIKRYLRGYIEEIL